MAAFWLCSWVGAGKPALWWLLITALIHHGGPTLRIPSKPATSQRPHPQMMTLWTPSFRPWASTCDFGSTAQSKSHASGSVDVPLCRVLGLDLQSVRVWCGPHGKFVAEPVLLSPLFLSVGRCSHCELTDRVCGVRYVWARLNRPSLSPRILQSSKSLADQCFWGISKKENTFS